MSLRAKIQYMLMPLLMKPMLKWMNGLEAKVAEIPGAIRGSDHSPVRFNLMVESLKLKDEHPPMPGFPRAAPYQMSSIRNINRSVRELGDNPPNAKRLISAEDLEALVAYAHEVGVDAVGFAEVPQEWVFKGTAILHHQAVVLVREMDKARIETAPCMDTAVMVHETYDTLGQASNKIARWLRGKGFSVHAGHPLNGMALYPPMAQRAGLGYRGLSGLLITPEFGPRVRLAAVFTEIENLPVYDGHEHDWVLDYCKMCGRCVLECPPGAIYAETIEHENDLVTCVETEKCFPYFANNHGCSICIKVCPFNRHRYVQIRDQLERKGRQQTRGDVSTGRPPPGCSR